MLLDGTYEVMAQRPLDAQRTLFEATAPDGAAVRVVWFELEPHQEAPFERYRKLLRTLRREGYAAIYDLVSRPGAHYVAWQTPPADARPPGDRERAAVRALLEPHGYTLGDAELVNEGDRPRLYSLAFEGASAETPVYRAPVAPTAPQPWWRSPMSTWAEASKAGGVHPPRWLLPWVPGLVFTGLGLLLLVASLSLRTNTRVVVMPDVLDTDVNAAAALLYAQGLTVESEPVGSSVEESVTQGLDGVTGGAKAANASAGTVVDVEPPPGARLRRGRTARLRYALPPGQRPQVEVPDLRGRPFEGSLRASLEAAGLTFDRVAHVPGAEARGLIVAQSLPPGSAPAGSALSLLVSEGPQGETTFVPDLRGEPLTEALTLARAAGFSEDRIERTWLEDGLEGGTEAPPGTVLGQNLTPYLETPLETATLRLLVAGAPDAGTNAPRAPDLIGMTRANAEKTAQETPRVSLGFTLIDEVNLPKGVVSQTPAPDAPLNSGALEVTLNQPGLFRPNVQVERRALELRRAAYRFPIEANVPTSTARVEAHYVSGKREVVGGARVSGGETLENTWLTTEYGPITFVLYLNNIEYARDQTNP